MSSSEASSFYYDQQPDLFDAYYIEVADHTDVTFGYSDATATVAAMYVPDQTELPELSVCAARARHAVGQLRNERSAGAKKLLAVDLRRGALAKEALIAYGVQHGLEAAHRSADSVDPVTTMPFADRFQEAAAATIELVSTYDGKTDFHNLSTRHVRREVTDAAISFELFSSDYLGQTHLPLSADTPDPSKPELSLDQTLTDSEQDAPHGAPEDTAKAVYEALGKVTERQKQIITMQYGLNGDKPMTQAEIATTLGTTRTNITRQHTVVMRKLREHHMHRPLQQYHDSIKD